MTHTVPAYQRFAIGFDARDRARLHELWDGVLDSNRWSEADLTSRFEAAWEAHGGLGAVAASSWTGGALDFAHLTPALLALGLAGAGIGMLGVMSGRRTSLEPALERSEG